MKLNKNFVSHNSEGTTLLIPVGIDANYSDVLKGNEALGTIWNCLREETNKKINYQTNE